LNKRIIVRLWGHRQRGGFVYRNCDLANALKKGEAVEVGKIIVGSKQLRELVRLMPYEHCLVRSNGSLEIESLKSVWRGKPPAVKCHFEKPRRGLYTMFKIFNGAWKPKDMTVDLVVIKPEKH
jgi:hypothetical protein